MDVEYARDLSMDNRKGIAEYYVKWDYKDYDGNLRPEAKAYVQQGKDLMESLDHNWNTAEQRQRDVLTMVAYLTATKYKQETIPVEFVRFDEDLYQCLVDQDCATTRGVHNRGRVEIDSAKLHQYF